MKCDIKTLYIEANQRNDDIDLWSTVAFNVGSKICINKGNIGNLEIIPKGQSPESNEKTLNTEVRLESITISTFSIHDVNIVSGFVLDSCQLKKYGRIHPNSKLSHYTSFMNSQFSSNEENLSFFRILKKKFKEIDNEHEAQHFLSLELEAQKRFLSTLRLKNKNSILKKDISMYLEVALANMYSRFNKFGRDLFSPLYWLFFLWLVTAAYGFCYNLFHFNVSSIWDKKFIMDSELNGLSDFVLNLIYAFKLILGPAGAFLEMKGFHQNIPSLLLSTFVQILSTVIWFLYVLQIKQRFSVK